jgi:spermidine synthase
MVSMPVPSALATDSRRVRAATRAALVLLGFTAVVAQVVLMRELIVVFYGNEVSLGLMLCSWLLWTSAGSAAVGRISTPDPSPLRRVAAFQVLLALALPLTILAVRSSKLIFRPLPGELLGPGPMLLVALVTLSLFCFVSGGLFAVGSRLYAAEAGTSVALASSSMYLLEALGSGAGGILASLVLIGHLSAVQIAAILGWLNLIAATALAVRRRAYRSVMLGMLTIALPLLWVGGNQLEEMSLKRLWRGFHLLATRNSIYGNLAVVETEGMRSLYENGLVAFNVPDPAAAEEAVHFALLQHPHPSSLLLIGGGLNGSVAQAFQHPSLERADYVELDPAVFDLARRYFPEEWKHIEGDKRVRLHHLDGRLFVKSTNEKFDVVIVNLPDPQTAQLNRFYTVEFFREVAEKLTSGGVLAIQLRAAENYISPELGEFLRCVNRTLQEVFPEISVIPGDTVHYFASRRPGVLAKDAEELVSRLRARRLQTRYVREYYFPFRMMPDRMQELESQIRPQPATAGNRDFVPLAYYFHAALWSAQFHTGYSRWFRWFGGVRFVVVAGALIILVLAISLATFFGPGDHRRAVAGFSVAAMGLTLMSLQVLLLLGFQAIFGYVYSALAILVGAFMMGLALGSWWSLRPQEASDATGRETDLRRLGRLQFLAALAPLLLFGAFEAFARIGSGVGAFLSARILFPGLALLCGILGGFQFPVASRIFFAGDETRGAGTLYALDLIGACLGALLLSTYLVPVFGFLKIAALIALVNVFPAALTAVVRRQPRVA